MKKKNDIFVLDIIDMSSEGEGIGKTKESGSDTQFTWFVKDSVIGDRVEVLALKVKRNYGFAKVVKVLEPSKFRVEPRCEFHRQCGGCQIQALDYNKQLEFKHNKVKNNLERIGGFRDIEVLPVIGMDNPFNYRNKAQFPIGAKDGKIIAGFYAGRTHNIIANTNCHLGHKINEPILKRVISFMEENNISPYDEKAHTGLVRHVLIRVGFATNEVMVCIVINGESLPHSDRLVELLSKIDGMASISININKKQTNVIMGDIVKTLWGQEYITDYIGDIKYNISPLSFYQVNPVQTKKLYDKALEYAALTGNETVWDLYCGIGTISLFLAKKAKQVYGVEIVSQAIEDAKNNARINNIENVKFYVGKAEEVLPYEYEHNDIKADVIVVDPPRKGCDSELLDTIVKMQPERVVYVSCDSATLARDLKYICERGYEIVRVQAVDMFGMSVHVETVCLMSKVYQ